MSIIGVHLPLFSGSTGLSLQLYTGGTLVNSGGDALTESGSSGYFTADVAESLAGLYRADVRNASNVLIYQDWLNTPAGLVVGTPNPAVTVITSPLTVREMERVRGKTIKVFYRESIAQDIQVLDTDLNPVDLSGRTLRFVIAQNNGKNLQVIENASIVRVNDLLGQIRVTFSKAATSIPGTHEWTVRDIVDGDRVLGYGNFIVESAAAKS
jgi:hypothetical protein